MFAEVVRSPSYALSERPEKSAICDRRRSMRYSPGHRLSPSTRTLIGRRMLRQRSSISSRIASAFRDWSVPTPRRRRRRAHLRDPDIMQARATVVVSGLPESAVRAAERRGEVDWRPLAAALDSLYLAKGGAPGVRVFLTSPQRSLSGRVPAELIARNRDLQGVARAVYRESLMADLSRTA